MTGQFRQYYAVKNENGTSPQGGKNLSLPGKGRFVGEMKNALTGWMVFCILKLEIGPMDGVLHP